MKSFAKKPETVWTEAEDDDDDDFGTPVAPVGAEAETPMDDEPALPMDDEPELPMDEEPELPPEEPAQEKKPVTDDDDRLKKLQEKLAQIRQRNSEKFGSETFDDDDLF